jgi:hypothetical protein
MFCAWLSLFLQPVVGSESVSLSIASETPIQESISVVRIKDDLMVRWLCPGLQKTSLFVLNGDEQWEAAESAFTLDPETQYLCLPQEVRVGFFRTSQEVLQEFPRLWVMMPARYVSGLPLPVRVEAMRPDGSVDWEVWDGQVSILSSHGGVSVSPQTLDLHSGVASGLLTIEGTGSPIVSFGFDGSSVDKSSQSVSPENEVQIAGELSDSLTVWTPNDGIIHVTDNLTLPVGNTLRIYPDTIILLDAKKSITVRGTIESLGTVEHPVLFAAADPQNPWGQIHHDHTAIKSSYQGTFFVGGGDSSSAGHTERGPVIRVSNAEIEFDYCSVMDNYGKGLYASGGNLTFNHCHFARSAMGMEVVNVNIAIDRCSFIEMPMGGDVADNDPLYLNGSGNMSVTNSIFAIGGDDGIDLLSSSPVIENCVIHGFLDKGISVYFGAPHISNCLILDNDYGISAKGDGTDAYVDRTTIVKNRVNIQSRNKYNEPNAIIKYYITNSILWEHTTAAVQTDYPLDDISITYSCVEGAAPFPGVGNINDDPRFVNPLANDFRLQNDSRCLGSGKDGADMGFTYPDSP